MASLTLDYGFGEEILEGSGIPLMTAQGRDFGQLTFD